MRLGIVVAAAGLGLAAAPPAAAAGFVDWLTTDTYVGVGLGTGNSDASESDGLSPLPSTVTSVSIDESGTAWRLFVGKRLGPNLGVEFALVDLGKIDFAVAGATLDTPGFLAAVARATPVAPGGMTLDLTGDWTFADFGADGQWAKRWFVTSRTGLFAWQTDVSYSDGTTVQRHKDDGISPHFGIGAGMHVTEHFDARFDIDHYAATTGMNALSLGLVYRF